MKVKEAFSNDFKAPTLHTKFGTAKVDGEYYRICSSKERNFGKRLHRLIYEDFHGIKLSQDMVVHHKNGNKLDNSISNLEAMPNDKHSQMHNAGEKNGMYGKKHSKEALLKISNASKGRFFSKESREKIGKHNSLARNTSGYFRVSKYNCKNCKQGFIYVYEYLDETHKRKSLSSINIDKLRERVLAKGLEWIEYGGESNDPVTV